MKLIIGRKYIIVFEINSKFLTYTAIITDIDENYISFKDKYGKKFQYKKSTFISSEEVENE